MTSDLRFERFDKAKHRREDFDCGVPALNDYLKTRLNQQMARGVTAGYVLAAPDGRIAGYMTLSSGELQVGVIPDGHGFPMKLPLPTTLLGRLAVDQSFRGQGLGELLLIRALRLAVMAAQTVASAAIEVDAKDESTQAFYGKYGFQSLPDDKLHMYLPISDAKAIAERFGRGPAI